MNWRRKHEHFFYSMTTLLQCMRLYLTMILVTMVWWWSTFFTDHLKTSFSTTTYGVHCPTCLYLHEPLILQYLWLLILMLMLLNVVYPYKCETRNLKNERYRWCSLASKTARIYRLVRLLMYRFINAVSAVLCWDCIDQRVHYKLQLSNAVFKMVALHRLEF